MSVSAERRLNVRAVKTLVIIVGFLFIAGFGKTDLQEGKAYFAARQPFEAIDSFTKAIQTNPKDQEAYFFRGAAYSAMGQFNQAIKDYTKAIELNPKYSQAYWSRGYCYANMGIEDKAVTDYTKSLKLGTKVEALVYQLRGGAYYRQGMFKEAEADLGKVLQLNPGDQKSIVALAEIKTARNDPDFKPNALKFRHITEQPQYGGVKLTATLEAANDKYIQATTQFYGTQERAHEEALKLAWKIYNQGEYGIAMRRFNQAWLLNKNDPEVFYGYSLILRQWGYNQEADKWKQKAQDGGYNEVSKD